MYKLIITALLFSVLTTFSACKGDYEVTSDGTRYRFFVKNEGPKPKIGDFVQMRLSYLATIIDSNNHEIKDSVLFHSAVDEFLTGEPLTIRLGKIPYKGSPNELLTMMSKGDSAEILTHPDSFYIHHISGAPAVNTIKKSDMLKVRIKLLDFMGENEMKKKMDAINKKKQEIAEAKMKESERMLDSIAKKIGKAAMKTEGGTYVHVTKSGNGPSILPETKLMVSYKGTLLNGQVFDQGEFPLQVGTASVIQGWKEGLMKLKVGDEATLYIPFWQAYGDQMNGDIPPYSTLIFNIKVKANDGKK